MELNTRYQIILGKNNNNDTCNSNDNESDKSGEDDMQTYNGFAGGIRTREAIYVASD